MALRVRDPSQTDLSSDQEAPVRDGIDLIKDLYAQMKSKHEEAREHFGRTTRLDGRGRLRDELPIEPIALGRVDLAVEESRHIIVEHWRTLDASIKVTSKAMETRGPTPGIDAHELEEASLGIGTGSDVRDPLTPKNLGQGTMIGGAGGEQDQIRPTLRQ